jgi:hypothetical protein
MPSSACVLFHSEHSKDSIPLHNYTEEFTPSLATIARTNAATTLLTAKPSGKVTDTAIIRCTLR